MLKIVLETLVSIGSGFLEMIDFIFWKISPGIKFIIGWLLAAIALCILSQIIRNTLYIVGRKFEILEELNPSKIKNGEVSLYLALLCHN